jgi:hypothetical protein
MRQVFYFLPCGSTTDKVSAHSLSCSPLITPQYHHFPVFPLFPVISLLGIRAFSLSSFWKNERCFFFFLFSFFSSLLHDLLQQKCPKLSRVISTACLNLKLGTGMTGTFSRPITDFSPQGGVYGSLNVLTGPIYEVSILADTMQLIVAILKEFVYEVVRGSLISRE